MKKYITKIGTLTTALGCAAALSAAGLGGCGMADAENQAESEAQIAAADIRETDIKGANILETDTQETDIKGANILETDTQETDTQETDIRETDTQKTDILETDTRESDILETDTRETGIQKTDTQKPEAESGAIAENGIEPLPGENDELRKVISEKGGEAYFGAHTTVVLDGETIDIK